MPRNNAGTFTLLNAAFTPGTVISSSAVNGDLSDIATGLTQSLATTGVSSMTGQIKAIDGLIGSPGYSFVTDTTSGIYRSGSTVNISVSGTNALTASTTLITVPALTSSGALTANGAFSAASTSTFTGGVTLNSTSYTFGAGAPAAFWAGIGDTKDITFVVSTAPVVLTSGNKGQIHIPFPLTINKWWIMAEQSGSIVFDILRANNAVPSASIVGTGNKPTLSSAQFNSATPSGWTATTLVKDDFIDFSVSGSPTSIQTVTVTLTCTRTG